ncbi:MAG TPA: hypothetical protein VH643_29325 [Gemmataceae bacterium]|jgi:excisionase family DNA binding protein
MSAIVRQVINAKVASEQLGVSLGMVYKLLRLGRLEGYSIGRRKLIYLDSLDALRRKGAIGPAAAAPAPSPEPAPRKPRQKVAVKPLVLPVCRHLR